MAKKPSKASTSSRSAGRRGDAAEPASLPGLEPPQQSGPTDPTDDPARLAQTSHDPAVSAAAPSSPSEFEPPPPAAATIQPEWTAPGVNSPTPPLQEAVADGMPPTRPAPVPLGRGWRFARNELVALGGFAILGLISSIWFFRCLYAHPAEIGHAEVARRFPQPLKGQFLTLERIDTGWRDRLEADRVRAQEVVLPKVHLKIDSSASSAGFVRIEFIDTEGKIRGDISTVTVEGGRFKDSGRGEQVNADGTEATVSSTVGFSSRALFTVYRGGEETRWSVRLREGADYSNGPWSLMGQAQISDRKP